VPLPDAVAGIWIEGANISDAAKVSIRLADEGFALIGNRRHRIIAGFRIFNRLPVPDLLASFGVEGGKVTIVHSDEDLAFVDSNATIARKADLLHYIRRVLSSPFSASRAMMSSCAEVT
jgi:hypothetical protein